MLLDLLPHALPLLAPLADEAPNAEDVKAGWPAMFILLGLIAAVAVLGWSLSKQLRKAQAAEDAGVYGNPPVTPQEADPDAPVEPAEGATDDGRPAPPTT